MAVVQLVCDASYDKNLRVAGLAGGLYVSANQEIAATHMYQGILGEVRDIQEGELAAILIGLKELERRSSISELLVARLDIFSDNKPGVLLLIGEQSQPYDARTARLLSEIHGICTRNKWPTTISHVNAHVPLEKATPIETLNFVADERASIIRRSAIDHLFHPKISGENRRTTVLLPKKVTNQQEAAAFRMLGQTLVANGRISRVFFDGNLQDAQVHPFFAGAMHSASHYAKKPVSQFISLYQNKLPPKFIGMDHVLYRHHAHMSGWQPSADLSQVPAAQLAAMATRALYGEAPSPMASIEGGTGRLQPPSCVVYDLMDPMDNECILRPSNVQGWVHTLLDYVDIPIKIGITESLKHAGIEFSHDFTPRPKQAPPSLANSTVAPAEDALYRDVREAFELYSQGMPPADFGKKILRVLHRHGAPNTEAFNDSLERFIYATSKGDSGTFTQRVMRHAKKMSPVKAISLTPPPATLPPINAPKLEASINRRSR